MYKLLKINTVELPNAEGDFSIHKKDKFNEYETEDGKTTVEVVRQGIISLSVSFNGLTETMVKRICDAITLVSTVEIFDPVIGKTKEIRAKVTDIKTKKIFYKNNLSIWSLSFNVDEL